MDDYQLQKIKQFYQDNAMRDAVYNVLISSFLSNREGDTHTKAAQRIAIDIVNDSWDDLRKIYNANTKEIKEKKQTAL